MPGPPRTVDALMVQRLAEGWTVIAVAAAAGVDPKTVRKWRQRHAAEGAAGLVDRSSRPHHSPTRLSAPAEAAIEALRRQRRSGTAIARELGRPVATVGRVLRRLGLGRLSALDPKPPVIRYQREQPGELLHIDVKKLGKIDGVGHRITDIRHGQKRGRDWEFLHVCVDDASRLAYTEILPDERHASAVAFLKRALVWFAGLGVTGERVMTDNGSADRSYRFREVCDQAGLKHHRTRPYIAVAEQRCIRWRDEKGPARGPSHLVVSRAAVGWRRTWASADGACSAGDDSSHRSSRGCGRDG